jgi:VanZ family protein
MASAPINTTAEAVTRRRIWDYYTLPLAIWVSWIAYASLAPSSGLPHIEFPAADKFEHGSHYALLGLLWLRAWVRLHRITFAAIIGTLAVCAAWGFYLEVLQALTGFRSFDFGDLLANVVGAFIGIIALMIWRRKRAQRVTAPEGPIE